MCAQNKNSKRTHAIQGFLLEALPLGLSSVPKPVLLGQYCWQPYSLTVPLGRVYQPIKAPELLGYNTPDGLLILDAAQQEAWSQ